MRSPREVIESSVRQGRLCAGCHELMKEPWPGHQQYCAHCGRPQRINCTFVRFQEWMITTFTEEDRKTIIGNLQYRTSSDRIRGLYEKYGADKTRLERGSFEEAMRHGCGSVWLDLPHGDYLKLKKEKI